MPESRQTEMPPEAETSLKPELAALFAKTKAREFGISGQQFLALLDDIAAKNRIAASEKYEFFSRLQLEDLVLARACASGIERAWEIFMLRFREKLYGYARQITREDSSGRELADSLYADLFGTRTRDGSRVSKLASYCGRGSLDGWLRTVLAQEYVNSYRRTRKLVSLDEESEEGVQFASAPTEITVPADSRVEKATDQALRALDPEERFVLASYFLDGRTLAEIARAVRVHESTISRKVEKLTKALRKQILKNLQREGVSRREAEEALSGDVRDFTLDIRASLAQDSLAAAFSEKRAKAGEGGN